MSKTKASLIHLSLSVLVISFIFLLIFFVWYPSPFDKTQGISEILYLMLIVDLFLGPLLTFVVYKQGKRGLATDLSIIATIQISALIYALYVVHKERPAYIVHAIDRYEVVTASEVNMQESSIPEMEIGFFTKPNYIYVESPKGDAMAQLVIDVLSGASNDLERLPQYYQLYEKNIEQVLSKGKELSSIANQLSLPKGIDPKEYLFAPIVGKRKDMLALINKKTGYPEQFIDVDPWTIENN
ncbi:MAG: hypothetical protein HWD86_10265 [Kangiellaceae bacterium]|nr:hypothetical protein [Kangiellaceae bacterium]